MQYMKKVNNIYHFRLRVSEHLKQYFQRSEIHKSLETTNHKNAFLKAMMIHNQYKAILKLSKTKVLNAQQIQIVINKFITDVLEQSITANAQNQKLATEANLEYNHMERQTNNISGKTYQEAYEEFKIYYSDKKISHSTIKDTFRVLDRFMIMIGKDTLVNVTKMIDLIKIKQQIENLPITNLKEYKSLSFEHILKLNTIPSNKKITDSRVKDYLKHIKKFFAFCHQNQIIYVDPSVNITITVASDKKDDFSDKEAKELLRLFDLQREHIKLLLYVYAYSGMRREELYNSTIEEENSILYFKITKGKNNYSIRKVPLHNNLIALGLNNDLLSNATKRISYQKIGRIFNETIRPQVTSSGKQTLHSWRHTFATKLQEQNVSDNIIRNLIGHSANDTLNRVYARKATNIHLLKDAIDLLDFG